MDRDIALLIIALALAITAAVFDVQQHRIPNWLTYPGIVSGLVLRGVLFGWKGLRQRACRFLAGGRNHVCVLHGAGHGSGRREADGGDRIAGGTGHAVVVLLATAICGGVLAIGYAVYRRRMWATLRNVGSVLRFHAWAGLRAHPELNLDNPAALRMPYGLAIAAGTLYAFLVMWWR